ncbi:MAG: carboxypeptidase-like regulatory domain-containing protein [Planctomycetota bacterium]
MRIFLIAFGALAVLVGGISVFVRTRPDDIGQDKPRTTKLDPDEQLGFLREANLLDLVGGLAVRHRGMLWPATVRVVDAEGEPVPSVRVWIEPAALAEQGKLAAIGLFGRPLPSSSVHLEVPRNPRTVFGDGAYPDALTDGDGFARLDGSAGNMRVACDPGDHRVGESILFWHDASYGPESFQLRVVAGVTRRGRLQHPDGSPVEGFVRARWRRLDRAWYGDVVKTDADGRFELRVHPDANHVTSWLASGLVVEHEVPSASAGWTIEVPRADRLVHVRVRDAQGGPVPAAIVRVHMAEPGASVVAACDGAGAARVMTTPGLLRSVRVESLAHLPGERVFPPGDEIDIVLPALSHVEGLVRDTSTGQPVEDARVVLRPAAGTGDSQALGMLSAQTTADGTYRIERVSPGRYLVELSHGDLLHEDVLRALLTRSAEPPSSCCIEVRDDGAPVTCDLSLVPGVLVRGRVTPMPDGAPGFYITAEALLRADETLRAWGFPSAEEDPRTSWDAGLRHFGRADTEERFEVRMLPDVPVRLACWGMLYVGPAAPSWTPNDARDQAPPVLEYVLGGQVSGVVARPDGTPVEGARLEVIRAGEGVWAHVARGTDRTSVDGAFWLGWLPPGPVVVRIHVPGQPAVDRDLPPLDVSEVREGVELIVADP